MPDLQLFQTPFLDLPEGTVTFLFTDIEGSTQLLQRLREQYAVLLSDQRRLLRQAFTHWGGREVDTQGDAFCVAFPRATQAVAAAVEISAQQDVISHCFRSLGRGTPFTVAGGQAQKHHLKTQPGDPAQADSLPGCGWLLFKVVARGSLARYR